MDVSFHESEPYYSGDVSKHSLKGENSSEENKFQDGGNSSFIELDEVHKFFTENNEQGCGKVQEKELSRNDDQQGCDDIHETENELSVVQENVLEFPMSTPSTEESTHQNVPSQVT